MKVNIDVFEKLVEVKESGWRKAAEYRIANKERLDKEFDEKIKELRLKRKQ